MIIEYLKQNGPCVSTELAKHLIENAGISPEAARQRIRRAPKEVIKLQGLNFVKGAKFLYLKKQYGSPKYWTNLYTAIHENGGAHSLALRALNSRACMPISDFKISCGSPLAQKKHITADNVINSFSQAEIITRYIDPRMGECFIDRRALDSDPEMRFLANVRARIDAEGILLNCIKEWLRNLCFASYNKVHIRHPENIPQVGTFAWDLTAPSYITASYDNDQLKPGFIACDVLLKTNVAKNDIQPFINKVCETRNIRNIKNVMFIFVAQGYSQEAFNILRSHRVITATTESIFGLDIANSFSFLVNTLSEAHSGKEIRSEELNRLTAELNKMKGEMGNMRGTLFELIVAEIVRKTSVGSVRLNKKISTDKGDAEIDVWVYNENIRVIAIECKGYKPSSEISDEEVLIWLQTRIQRIRRYIHQNIDESGRIKVVFELWTSGIISEYSLNRINKTREANSAKFDLIIVGPEEISKKLDDINDSSLKNSTSEYFLHA